MLKENLLQDIKPAASKLLQQGFKQYNGEDYSCLAVLLGYMRGLQLLQHSHHWQTQGNSFYGDHLLFQRIYEGMTGEVDTIGEKVVGLGQPSLTNYFKQHSLMKMFLDNVTSKDNYFQVSLRAELMFCALGEVIMDGLKNKGLLTVGLEQALGTILDTHETYIYLLKQKVAQN